MSEDITKELWATYSVKDHLEPRALAADIMLFDRLVFPVPEKPHLPNSAPAHMPGPVEWRADATEWARWRQKRWDPAGQQKLLTLIEKVVRKVPWDSTLRDKWRAE